MGQYYKSPEYWGYVYRTSSEIYGRNSSNVSFYYGALLGEFVNGTPLIDRDASHDSRVWFLWRNTLTYYYTTFNVPKAIKMYGALGTHYRTSSESSVLTDSIFWTPSIGLQQPINYNLVNGGYKLPDRQFTANVWQDRYLPIYLVSRPLNWYVLHIKQ